MKIVSIVPVGAPISSRVDLPAVVKQLNAAQHEFRFELADAVLGVPKPTVENRLTHHESPQFSAAILADYLIKHRQTGNDVYCTVGLVDSEIFDELYSTVSTDNRVILVSTRVPGLEGILKAAYKSYEDYTQIEIAAQLLAVEYRRRADLHPSPEECAAPWHIERRNCLLDYYGLDVTNITKLVSPSLSPQTIADLLSVEVPNSLIEACLGIVHKAARLKWRAVLDVAPTRPSVSLPLAFATGFASSYLAAGLSPVATSVAGLGCLVSAGMGVRRLRRGR